GIDCRIRPGYVYPRRGGRGGCALTRGPRNLEVIVERRGGPVPFSSLIFFPRPVTEPQENPRSRSQKFPEDCSQEGYHQQSSQPRVLRGVANGSKKISPKERTHEASPQHKPARRTVSVCPPSKAPDSELHEEAETRPEHEPETTSQHS